MFFILDAIVALVASNTDSRMRIAGLMAKIMVFAWVFNVDGVLWEEVSLEF